MGAMGASPPPPSLPPRTLGQLLPDSWAVYRAALPEVAAAVAWGAVPAALLTAASAALTGIDGRETLKAAVEAGDYGRVGAASAFGLAARFLGALAGLAVYPVIAGRVSGTAVSAAQAYGFVGERFWSLVKTVVRQVVFVLLGMLCFVVPGIVLAFRYALSQPAVMLEGLAGAAALARSTQFMGRFPGKVVGNMFVCWALTVAAVLLLVFGLGVGTFVCGLAAPKSLHPALDALQGVAGGYADAMGSAWLTTFLVLLYGDLMRAEPAEQVPG